MKVLWFSHTPGLAIKYLKGKSFLAGWIGTLQAEVEKVESCELGFVFYTDRPMNNFTFGRTAYFPVQRKLNTKVKRYAAKLISKVEYDENLNRFLAIVDEFKPDVIHVHGTESPFGLIVSKITEIPVIVSIQGNVSVILKKYFSGIDYGTIARGWKSLFGKAMLEYKSFKKKAIIEAEIMNHVKYVFGRTDWDRRITRVMAPQANYFLMDEIMRPSFYSSRWLPKKSDHIILFTTSSDNLYKGFETIVETAVLLKKGNHSFEWLVAGLGLHDELVRFSMKLHSVDNLESIGIKLMGLMSAEDMIEKMLTSDLYVQVSHIENSPNSVCEAMLLGMPIIASDAGGTSSFIQHDKTGVLIQDGDSHSLAGAILELSSQKNFAESLGKAAFDTAHERHDSKRIVTKLIDTYSEIVDVHT
jgi:glycosyltransferase involved in cell wall biosynthesis